MCCLKDTQETAIMLCRSMAYLLHHVKVQSHRRLKQNSGAWTPSRVVAQDISLPGSITVIDRANTEENEDTNGKSERSEKAVHLWLHGWVCLPCTLLYMRSISSLSSEVIDSAPEKMQLWPATPQRTKKRNQETIKISGFSIAIDLTVKSKRKTTT